MDPTLRPGDERISLTRQADEAERLRGIAERLGTTLEQSLARGAAEGGRFERVLQRLQRSVTGFTMRMIRAPLQDLVRRGIGSLLGGLSKGAAPTPFASGGVIAAGRVTPFAQGGVVAAPT